jgi:hypothetical protein
MTREQFFSSPMGIALIGLIIGIVVILTIRAIVGYLRGKPDDSRMAPPPRARGQSMTFPEHKK